MLQRSHSIFSLSPHLSDSWDVTLRKLTLISSILCLRDSTTTQPHRMLCCISRKGWNVLTMPSWELQMNLPHSPLNDNYYRWYMCLTVCDALNRRIRFRCIQEIAPSPSHKAALRKVVWYSGAYQHNLRILILPMMQWNTREKMGLWTHVIQNQIPTHVLELHIFQPLNHSLLGAMLHANVLHIATSS